MEDISVDNINVGDKILIIDNTHSEFVSQMRTYIGRSATVTRVLSTCVLIDIDSENYYWFPPMFDLIVNQEFVKLNEVYKIYKGEEK